MGWTTTPTGGSTRASDGAAERPDKTLATEVDGAASAGAPDGVSTSSQPASSSPRPASGARALSRSPQGPRIDHFARAQFRVLPGLCLYGRLDPAVWRIDHCELDRDSVFHLRFSSRVAEGDAAAGPARYRVHIATASLVVARVAVRLRPESSSDRQS